MRVVALTRNPAIYTCRSYLLLGDWNRLADVNTLIDPGSDDTVIREIETLATGCGKEPVERIILTHNHFDHAAGTLKVKKRFGARVNAWCEGEGVDELLRDGQLLRVADDWLQVLHTPGHSSDSICLYNSRQQLLFSGDTWLRSCADSSRLSPEYVETLRRLAALSISTVYSGHDPALSRRVREAIGHNLASVKGRGPVQP
jgi:glyoxylase-like metal-dependent hydrolase (beta-lactamase superfamily II)